MEEFPLKTACTSLLFTILSYVLGSILLFALNPIIGLLYLFLWMFTTVLSLKLRCAYCVYYGKLCGFGFGKLCKVIFKQGDPKECTNPRNIAPIAVLSLGASVFPIIGGIILNVSDFSLLNLLLLITYVIFGITPNFFIRRSVCERCKQGKLGCPAYKQTIKKGNND